jgi:ribonuclease P protein component
VAGKRLLPGDAPRVENDYQRRWLSLWKWGFSLKSKKVSAPSYRKVYDEGRSISNRYLVAYYLPDESVKMGVSVPKRLGKAVVRNKLRRRVKEAFRRLSPLIEAGGQFVFIVRRPSLSGTYWDIEDAMTQLVRRMGLL